MAKLWRGLLGRESVTRYSVDDYAADLSFAFGAGRYAVGYPGGGAWARTEDIENSFSGYVQSAYKTNGIIFAIMLARLLLFSEGRFCWYEVGADGSNGNPAGRAGLEVLETPWPNGSSAELLARADQDASFGGNFYAVREDSRLRRLRPDWLTIVLTAPPAEAVKSDVAGYWFHPGRSFLYATEPGPNDEMYLPEEICHWSPIPDPDAQYRGMSWVTPVIHEVMADKSATLHKQRFFDNGATLGQIIASKENLTEDQFKEWKANLLDTHQGVDNAYRPLFLASPVDTSVMTADMRQLDFKVTQGAGETRLCAAGGVPPIIVGLSEGLASATYSNYGMARRKFGDHWARPMWKSLSHALTGVTDGPPRPGLRLGINDKDIAFLREDQKDAADIQQTQAITIKQYIDAGFKPDSVIAAVDSDDRSLLEHTGLYSVQLLPPTSVQRLPARTLTAQIGKEAIAPADQQSAAEAASAAEADGAPAAARAGFSPDRHPRHPTGQYRPLADHMGEALQQWVAGDGAGDPFAGYDRQQLLTAAKTCGIDVPRGASQDEIARLLLAYLHKAAMTEMSGPQDGMAEAGRAATPSGAEGAARLHAYWTRGEGLAKWADSPHPWTSLYHSLLKYLPPEEAKRTAAEWFHDVFHFWPGADLNRVTHGKPPRGDVVGPG